MALEFFGDETLTQVGDVCYVKNVAFKAVELEDRKLSPCNGCAGYDEVRDRQKPLCSKLGPCGSVTVFSIIWKEAE